MGLFPMTCVACNKPFMWFTGCLDHRCSECQKIKGKGKKPMKKAELEKEIEALKTRIAVLEARPVCYGHYCSCNQYYNPNPINPWYTYTTCNITQTIS